MSTDNVVDTGRRRFLIASTSVVGAIGAGFVAVPFIESWLPSERAKNAGAPVEVNISKLEVGRLLIVEWQSKPVWVLKRSKKTLADLPKNDDRLRDPHSENTDQQPKYAQNEYRSIKPEILVLVGICTHLGCSPTYRPDIAPADLGENWLGGFFCPCHSSRFDLAGRVFQGVPAPANLVVPPYKYISDNVIIVGEDQGAA
jgi:ubiquinol-cytochrome c reductase iron-sulfur subunit